MNFYYRLIIRNYEATHKILEPLLTNWSHLSPHFTTDSPTSFRSGHHQLLINFMMVIKTSSELFAHTVNRDKHGEQEQRSSCPKGH